jgi:hypothetical protein
MNPEEQVHLPDAIKLTALDPEFAVQELNEQMALAKEIMDEDRDLLRELAKQ